MYTPEALQDLHRRAHVNFEALIDHCRNLDEDEFDCEFEALGNATIRLAIHHMIGAEKYWIGVLQGRIDADDDASEYPTIESLSAYREEVFASTDAYLSGSDLEELNTARPMTTWGNAEKLLTPAHVVIRTQTHLYHHQGQVTAMCRQLGKPCQGLDFPILAEAPGPLFG